MGDALANEVQRVLTEQKISADVVIPVGGEFEGENLIILKPPSRSQTRLASLR